MKTKPDGQPARRFLFSVAGGYGHFHPLVPLASALKQAGHEVAFTSGAALRPAIEALGFTAFKVGGNLGDDPEYQELKTRIATMPTGLQTELFSYPRLWSGVAARLRTPQLVEICREWQPDLLVRETGEYAAAVAAEHLGIPHATISCIASLQGLAVFEREVPLYLDPVRQLWGLPPDPDLAALYRYLLLSYSPPTLANHEPGAGELGVASPTRSVPATTHFLSASIFDQAGSESLPGWITRLTETGQPIVYATLGTEANSEPGVYPRLLQTIIEGLRDLPLNLIVTLGRNKDPADFGPQPPNVHIERYIPQSLLLPLCDLMVMHAGSNTLLAAVDLGVPVVAVPLIADQFFNAQIVRSLELGQIVDLGPEVQFDHLTPALVGAAVEEVLNDPAYRQNVAQLRAEMRALPGQDYAVELIERIAAEHEPVLNDSLWEEENGQRAQTHR